MTAAPDYFIKTTDELHYQVNFQNTGTDTAYKVVVMDTLSPYLNVATVVSGASSHAYDFDIEGPGILEWTFNSINLPDSNTNELASHGFVKYRVKPKAGTLPLTVINNSASIYFDFNAPIKTNTVFNTIDTSIITGNETILYNNGTVIVVSPNPFSNSTTITLSGVIASVSEESIQFHLYDVLGRQIDASTTLL